MKQTGATRRPHGHFYQPPRESPWTGAVDRERSALPFHDWNERIHAYCYRSNVLARITDNRGRIERIVNNYARISFNFEPTLLNWLERAHPDTYARILDADRESIRNHKATATLSLKVTTTPYCRFAMSVTVLPRSDWVSRISTIASGAFRNHSGCPRPLQRRDTRRDDCPGLLYVILSPTQAQQSADLALENGRTSRVAASIRAAPIAIFHREGSGRSIAIFFLRPGVSLAIAFEGALAWSSDFVRPAGAGTRGGKDGELSDFRGEVSW